MRTIQNPKYEETKFCFGVLMDHYIKSRGTGGTKMTVNTDLITVETYVYTGKQLKTSCSYMGQNVKQEASRPDSSAV